MCWVFVDRDGATFVVTAYLVCNDEANKWLHSRGKKHQKASCVKRKRSSLADLKTPTFKLLLLQGLEPALTFKALQKE